MTASLWPERAGRRPVTRRAARHAGLPGEDRRKQEGTRPAHRYALIASLRERSLGAFDLPEGTVYPALYRLERDGLVGSEWDASAARRRRVYSLTPAGASVLAAKRRDWGDFVRGMPAVLGSGATEEFG